MFLFGRWLLLTLVVNYSEGLASQVFAPLYTLSFKLLLLWPPILTFFIEIYIQKSTLLENGHGMNIPVQPHPRRPLRPLTREALLKKKKKRFSCRKHKQPLLCFYGGWSKWGILSFCFIFIGSKYKGMFFLKHFLSGYLKTNIFSWILYSCPNCFLMIIQERFKIFLQVCSGSLSTTISSLFHYTSNLFISGISAQTVMLFQGYGV